MSDEYRPTQNMSGSGAGPSWSNAQASQPKREYNPTVQMGGGQGGQGQGQQFGVPQSGYPGAKTEVLRQKGPVSLAWLVIVEGPYMGHIFRLHPDATVIGRDPSCDVVLDDSSVSRQHVKIRVDEGEDKQPHFILHDLATENGTFVNGEEAFKQALVDGDYVKIGRTELVFKQVFPKKKDDA